MFFHDEQVQAIDLTKPEAIQELIEVHFCGHLRPASLTPSDFELLREFVEKAVTNGVSFQQFNELLLVLNQDRISRPFFEFFFGNGDSPLALDQLRQGVVRFKGFAMVCFGNFRFAFRNLSNVSEREELLNKLGQCCHASQDIQSRYEARAAKVLEPSC
jgi:hypothetical protein